jgi:hypothetical protein
VIIKNKFRYAASLLGLFLFLILAVGSVDDSGSSSKPSAIKNQKETHKKQPKSKEPPSPTQQTSVSQLKYNVVESKMLNDARVISVATTQFDRAKDIAMELVSQNKSYYMVRVFLYKPEQIPGRDLATIRYEWTESQGLVKSFDTRIPAARKDRDPTLPKYEVLFRVKQYMGNKRIYGDVLIVSLSRATPAKKREQVARTICRQERLNDICLYSTRDAYEANMSASYSKSHPDALKKGFLGSLTDGKFVAGEVLFP